MIMPPQSPQSAAPIASTRRHAARAPPRADGRLLMLVQAGTRPPDDPEEPKLADEGAGEEPKLDDEGAGAVAASARKASGEVTPTT